MQTSVLETICRSLSIDSPVVEVRDQYGRADTQSKSVPHRRSLEIDLDTGHSIALYLDAGFSAFYALDARQRRSVKFDFSKGRDEQARQMMNASWSVGVHDDETYVTASFK